MMNNGAVLFLGILLSLAGSFWALLLAPQLQIGRAQLRQLEGGELYPAPRPGLAQRGAEVYRSLGCAECHTRQVRQSGAVFDVRITDVGTNLSAVVEVYGAEMGTGDEGLDARHFRKLPALVGSNVTAAVAAKLMAQFAAVGAKAAPELIPLGPDMQRGWGARLSVAQDYLHDYPVQLGSLRLGPDLANYGARQTNISMVFQKLYAPEQCGNRMEMPAYRFLFKTRSITNGEPVPANAAWVWPAATNGAGTAGFASEDALALASYLLSLKADAPLFEAPRAKPAEPARPAPPATNAPAAAK